MNSEIIKVHPLPYQQLLATRPLSSIDLLVIHCTELPDLATAREYGERLHYPIHPEDNDDGKVIGPGNAARSIPVKSGGTGNSGHFYIDRDGTVEQWVAPQHIAHHVRGFNPRSVGIELVNRGRFPNWFHADQQDMTESYPEPQVDALLQLILHLRKELPALHWICGHAELDREYVAAADSPTMQVCRKLDPGPLFPWPQLMASCGLQRFVI